MDLPKKIYRFQRFNEQSIDTLCSDELYFSSPSYFNDPLDCKPSVVQDTDISQLRSVLRVLVANRISSEATASLKKLKLQGNNAESHSYKLGTRAGEQELRKIAYNSTNSEYQQHQIDTECDMLTQAIERELLAQYDHGICCFSTSVSNPLLWSHYADQHHGFCLGYSLAQEPEPKLHSVLYGGTRIVKTSLVCEAILQKDPKAIALLESQILLRKAAPWKYEKEWRLIGKIGRQESPLALVDITFGLRCPRGVIHTVIAALEARQESITFYEMTLSTGNFKLRRKMLDVDEIKSSYPNTARICF